MPELGIFISASIRTLLIFFAELEPCRISLLAHNVQENVSPTYAEPKAGGSVRRGERMKASFLVEGYAREAEGEGKTAGEALGDGEGVGRGRGCCIEREGRESLCSVLALLRNYFLSRRLIITSRLLKTQNAVL